MPWVSACVVPGVSLTGDVEASLQATASVGSADELIGMRIGECSRAFQSTNIRTELRHGIVPAISERQRPHS